MPLPEKAEDQFRGAIDRWLGTSHPAIHLRLAGAVGLFALAGELHRQTSLRAEILWATVTVLWLALFPRLRDLERVYGTRLVSGAIFLLALGVPLAFAAMFTAFVFLGDASTFRSPGAFRAVQAVCALLALAAWWAFYRVLGLRREFARLVFGRH